MACRNIVVIASSAGGPPVLTRILGDLPVVDAAVIIVQHMTKSFAEGFTGRLDEHSRMRVVLARNDMVIEPGKAYFAPGGVHLELVNNEVIHLFEGERVNFVCPSADVAMMSLKSPSHGGRLVGVVLTGLGRDGAAGMSHIKRMGGWTIAQSPDTTAVYGMPQQAIATGDVDLVLPPGDIAKWICKLVHEKEVG